MSFAVRLGSTLRREKDSFLDFGDGAGTHAETITEERTRDIIGLLLNHGLLVKLDTPIHVETVHTSSVPLTGRDAIQTPEIQATVRARVIRAVRDHSGVNDLPEFNALSYLRPKDLMPSFKIDLMPLAYYMFMSLSSYLHPKKVVVTTAEGANKEINMTILHACRIKNFSLPARTGYDDEKIRLHFKTVLRELGFYDPYTEQNSIKHVMQAYNDWCTYGNFSFAGERNSQSGTEINGTFVKLVQKIGELMQDEGGAVSTPDYTHCISFVVGLRDKMIQFQQQHTSHIDILQYFQDLLHNEVEIIRITTKGEEFRIQRLQKAVDSRLAKMAPIPVTNEEREYFHRLLGSKEVGDEDKLPDETIYSTTHYSVENIYPFGQIPGISETEDRKYATSRALNQEKLGIIMVSNGNLASTPEEGMEFQRFSLRHEKWHSTVRSQVVRHDKNLAAEVEAIHQRAMEIGNDLWQISWHPYLHQVPLAPQTLQGKTKSPSTWTTAFLINPDSPYYNDYKSPTTDFRAEELTANIIALFGCNDIKPPLDAAFAHKGEQQALRDLNQLYQDSIELMDRIEHKQQLRLLKGTHTWEEKILAKSGEVGVSA